MTEQPKDWDKELANIDRAMAKQGAVPAGAGTPVTAVAPRRRLIALAWFWTVLGLVLGVALLLWPYDKNCGIRLVFFLGAALLAVLMAVLGAFASWAHRQGAAMLLSLIVIVWAGVMGAREILPRAGYAREARGWTCPAPAPAPTPTTSPTPQQ
jgi:hypothetical protein